MSPPLLCSTSPAQQAVEPARLSDIAVPTMCMGSRGACRSLPPHLRGTSITRLLSASARLAQPPHGLNPTMLVARLITSPRPISSSTMKPGMLSRRGVPSLGRPVIAHSSHGSGRTWCGSSWAGLPSCSTCDPGVL